MLISKTVVLDVEGFRHRKEKFTVKELGVYTDNYLDYVSFLPATSYSELTTQQKQSFGWLTRSLHGIEWDTGNYPYIYLTQTIQSVRLRNPVAIFYDKGEKKVKFLSDLLECSIIDLNSLACPSISVNYFTQNCQNHSKGKNIFDKHCAKEKAIFYFNWLTIERGIDEGGSALVTEFNNLRLDYGEENLSLSISKDETIKTGNQFLKRKVKLLLTEDEICSFTHLYIILNIFSGGESKMSKTQPTVWPRRLLLMSKHPVGEEIDKNDPSLTKEIQHMVKEERVHKIVHYDKTERLAECFMFHMKEFLTEFNCYELFYVK